MFGQCLLGGMVLKYINRNAYYIVKADILWILVSEN